MDLRPADSIGRAGWLTFAGSALLGLVIGLLIFRGPSPAAGASPDAGAWGTVALVDALAPDFELESVDGELIRLSDLRGKIVALNFWATWCGPCRIEMPDLQERADRFAGRLEVLGVNFDETPAEVSAFRDELGLDFPLLLDPGAKVQGLYRVLGYPTTFFVDAEGMIRFQHIGLMSEGQLDEYLERLGLTG